MTLGFGDRLRRTAGVSVVSTEAFKRYLDFFLSYLIALVGEVSWVALEQQAWKYSVPCPGTFGVSFAMLAIDG